jgi:pimeloyl-ACP methyl ester carboxylesterase
MSNEGRFATDDGVRLFFVTRGDGPQKVLIPNGMHLRDDFEPLVPGRTLIFYDVRNRGRSDLVQEGAAFWGGVSHDALDLEAVRRHFGIEKALLIGHSYIGVMVIHYAMKHPAHVDRIVQIAPMEPQPGKVYPAHLTAADSTLRDVMTELGQLQKERESTDPEEFCRKAWRVLSRIYVVDPEDAHRTDWGRCDLPNERNFMKYWNDVVLPSIRSLDFRAEVLGGVEAPVLTVHGRKDRSAPYGGGREWALRLPNARLVTVENAGHAPWIEAPERVFGAIGTFLGGQWPQAAQEVESLEP